MENKDKIEKLKVNLDKIIDSYDAFYMINKYSGESLDGNTHKEEFLELLDYFKDDTLTKSAICWMLDCYDCYYKNDYLNDDQSAIVYLKNKLEELSI